MHPDLKSDVMKNSVVFKILLTLSLLLLPCRVFSQNTTATEKECTAIQKKGLEELEKGNNIKALEYFTKAEVLANKENLKKNLFWIKNNTGLVYTNLSNYGEALGYYNEALNLIKDSVNAIKERSSVLNNIGVIYVFEKDYETALDYFKQAYPLPDEKKHGYVKRMLGINLAECYNKLGNFREARKYLEEVAHIPESVYDGQLWKVNYAETLVVEGKLAEAEKMMLALADDPEIKSTDGCYECVVELLSKIYDRQDRIALAIEYAKKGLENLPEIEARVKFYNQLSVLYFKNKEYNNYKKYNDLLLLAKDSLATVTNRGLFESNKVKLKVQEYQNELKAKTEKQQTQQNLFILFIILGAVICFSVYRGLRNKITRQNQEKTIIERNQEITNLELEQKKKEHLLTETELENIKSAALFKQEQLKNKIAEKNRELSAKALYLSIRNELIEDTINSLTAIPEVTKNASVADHVKTLKKHLKSDAGWEDFISHFEKINPVFLKRLKERHTNLNGKDIRFICCVFMNLDIKEISNIFNVTYNAAKKRKQRIKEKMGIDEEASLYEYLLKLDTATASPAPEM
jgi:tetratricopeptide (TPR) repeat protein